MPRFVALAGPLLALAAAACGVPASVEGVLSQEAFALHATRPLFKSTASGRDMVVVLSEHDGETLSTVTVLVPHLSEVPLDEPVAVGAGEYLDVRPSISAAAGPLVVETRADGVEVLSADDPVRALSLTGTFTLHARDVDRLVGSFDVALDDGGYLEGDFVAVPSE